ncbi:hypothetical protein DPMN_152128 [Dreissena polymorpha]|uniref:Uncharacterized protein n=1 Tax=Dreissena polymorpha TaxID=45954 RepID=A0A9D4J7M0_DREPO|nr:hypothetical protein DPMN_152128 [Dreissena polymorpha]
MKLPLPWRPCFSTNPIKTANLRTNKASPPSGGHIFQQTETIFKLSLAIIKTNVQTKFHEDWSINVTPRVLTRQNCPAPCRPCFLLILTIFKLNRRIQEINVLTKFHEDWTKNVTSRAENCPAPGGHVFSPIWTFFELVRDINETNVLTKFHADWAKIVTSRVFTKFLCTPYKEYCPAPWRSCFLMDGTIFELNQYIIKTNILTKSHEDWASNVTSTHDPVSNSVEFHEDRIINVASTVFTRQMLTTHARRTTNDALRTTHDGQKVTTKAHHEHVVLW